MSATTSCTCISTCTRLSMAAFLSPMGAVEHDINAMVGCMKFDYIVLAGGMKFDGMDPGAGYGGERRYEIDSQLNPITHMRTLLQPNARYGERRYEIDSQLNPITHIGSDTIPTSSAACAFPLRTAISPGRPNSGRESS